MWRNRIAAILVLVIAGVLTPAVGKTVAPDGDSRRWAVFMGISEPRNFYQVSDTLYRGGRLSRRGAAQLRCFGINTVVSLRIVGGDERYVERLGLNYIHIPFKAWRPDEDQVVEFLRIATNPACQPVYVYCNHGADRTGMMSAAYRVIVQGWTKAEALQEMTEGPFGYNPRWQRVVQFICDMEVERIRCRAGLAGKQADL